MKILALAPDYPSTTRMPGPPRLFGLCRGLADRHHVSLAFFPKTLRRGELFELDPEVHRVFKTIHPLPVPGDVQSPPVSWSRKQRHRLTLEPFFSQRKRRPEYVSCVSSQIAHLTARASFDVILAESMELIQYIPAALGLPLVVDACDCMSLFFTQQALHARHPVRRLKLYLEAAGMKRWEAATARRADLVTLISDADNRSFRRSSRCTNTAVLPLGIDDEYFRPQTELPGPPRLVFTGVMGYGPNEDAALFFAHQIFPLIRSRYPEAQFWAVGDCPTEAVKRLSAHPGVSVTGYVEDIRTVIASADVFVCPLRYGTGIKNKLLAAFAMAKPVVATSISMNGLESDCGKHVLIGDEPRDFAARVIQLLEDRSLARSLGEQGRILVSQRYSYTALAAALEQALEGAMRSSAGAAPSGGSIGLGAAPT